MPARTIILQLNLKVMLYTGLLHTHSLLRYIVLLLLVVVVVKSLMGWVNKKSYDPIDNKLGLWLMISTHTQLLFGLFLYFLSPLVQFSSGTMKDALARYWTVEHIFIMLLAVILITLARITSKKLSDDVAKHRRMFILNTVAFLLIVGAISMSGRGIIIPTPTP